MEPKNLTNLIAHLGKFKDLKRSGWLQKGIRNPESDAEHSFSLALLVMYLAPKELDKCRCLELALVHDLAEIYTGDYTPEDKISPKLKLQQEQEAVTKLANDLNWPELIDLVNEYNNKNTKEALFVYALDKVDTVITAKYYDNEKRCDYTLVDEFAEYALYRLDNSDAPDINELKEILINLKKGK